MALDTKIVNFIIALITVSVIGGALIPLGLSYLVNLTSISGLSASLFAAGGIISILVVVGIFRAILGLVKGMGGR